MVPNRWTIQYGETRLGDTGGYVVTDPTGKTRLQFPTKTLAIAEAQKRNGWMADGLEGTYAAQATRADR